MTFTMSVMNHIGTILRGDDLPSWGKDLRWRQREPVSALEQTNFHTRCTQSISISIWVEIIRLSIHISYCINCKGRSISHAKQLIMNEIDCHFSITFLIEKMSRVKSKFSVASISNPLNNGFKIDIDLLYQNTIFHITFFRIQCIAKI